MGNAGKIRTIAIAGVGLIGGSFAMAIRKTGFDGEIIGVSSPRTIAEALRLQVIDCGEDLETACHRADLVYLATPISKILESIPTIARLVRPTALVTDAGSTKAAIVGLARQHFPKGVFLGGHPMAGKASRGVESADAELFRGRCYVLTPDDDQDVDSDTAGEFCELLKNIGSRLFIMDCGIHDKTVAVTSHLPQMASTALANTVASSLTSTSDLEISGPGLGDMTRLAGSSYEIWQDILATNEDAIRASLDRYINCLQTLRDELGTAGIAAAFASAAGTASKIQHKK